MLLQRVCSVFGLCLCNFFTLSSVQVFVNVSVLALGLYTLIFDIIPTLISDSERKLRIAQTALSSMKTALRQQKELEEARKAKKQVVDTKEDAVVKNPIVVTPDDDELSHASVTQPTRDVGGSETIHTVDIDMTEENLHSNLLVLIPWS